MNTRSLRLLEAFAQPKVSIDLSCDGNHLISGYIKSEMQFSTSASYKSALEAMLDDKSGYLGKLKSASELIGNFTGNKIDDSGFTQVSWQNSDTGSMSFTIRVISTDYSINVIDIYRRALRMTLPTEEGSVILRAPLGYSLTANAKSGEGSHAISVKIGDYFNAPNAYVCTQLSGTFSKVLLKGTGRPLYVDITISLQPRMTFNYQTVASWFIG